MLKLETLVVDAGETPGGVLTMSARAPRQKVKARVIRERDWRKVLAVVRAVERAEAEWPLKQSAPRDALDALRAHLRRRSVSENAP